MTYGGTGQHARPYHEIRRRQIMDRTATEAWAEPTLLVIAYDVQGRGGFQTENLEFGMPFEGVPLFTYGVELAADERLNHGDFPHVSCGVAKWKTETVDRQEVEGLYLGAQMWIRASAIKAYNLRFRFGFEGIAYKAAESWAVEEGT